MMAGDVSGEGGGVKIWYTYSDNYFRSSPLSDWLHILNEETTVYPYLVYPVVYIGTNIA